MCVATLILVHGAWHGAWCWDKLVPVLEARGHKVLTLDLPGHELPGGAPATTTLEDYGRAVAALANAQSEQVILVGHSMGGGVISQAPSYSTNIAGLIYLAAFVLQHGDSIAALAGAAEIDELSDHVDMAPDGGRTVIQDGAGSLVFYDDCTPEDQAAANARLIPQPIQPLMDALEDMEGRAMALPAAGIICTQDRAVHPSLQRMMCEARGMPAYDMEAGHSPFLSRPDALADLITTAIHHMEQAS